jgi:hypothetical protein
MRPAITALPLSPPTCQELEQTIGAAVAAVCAVVAQGLLDFQADGKICAGTRARGGRVLVELYELQQTNPFVDFDSIARQSGKEALRAHLAAQGNPPKANDVRINLLIGSVLELLAQVTAARVH